jgi:hypothetical protein
LTAVSSAPNAAAKPSGSALGAQNVLIADVPTAGGKTADLHVGGPVEALGPDKLVRQAVLTVRIYAYGETRYYVRGVPLGQQFKSETAARAEVARRIRAGTMGNLPLAAQQPPAQQGRRVALPGNNGTVLLAGHGGKNTVVEIAAREEMRNGRWQLTGYVAKRISSYSIESFHDSKARTAYGYPLVSQAKNTLIRSSDGGVITDLAQARQRVVELVASKALTPVSAAQTQELSEATPLAKPVAAMNNLDRVKYLLKETVRRLPAGVASELQAMLTAPETLVMIGAFCAAQAVPGLNVAAMIVGSLLLGNDILDTGGKMVDAVKLALSASSQADLVTAGKGLAEALAHGAVSVGSAVVGNRVGKAWKNTTSAEATSLRTLASTVKNYQAGHATPEQVRRAAIVAMQKKRAAAADATPKPKKPTTKTAGDAALGPPLPASTARRAGESMHAYLKRMGVKQSLTAEQQRSADNAGMRMSNKPADKPGNKPGTKRAQGTESTVPPTEGELFKAKSAALQRGLAAAEPSALPQAVLQAEHKLLSSLGREELGKLRARLAPRGVDLAEGVPQTEASFKALARLDTAALSGPLLRTVGFDFSANPLLKGKPTLMKAARGYAIRSLAAGQDPTRVVEDLKILFVGKLNKKTGAEIAPPLWPALEAALALPPGTAGSAAQRPAMDYALATYHQMASRGAASATGGAGPSLDALRSYASTAPAQRPTAPWPTARWNNLHQHLVYDAKLDNYKNRFTGSGVPTPYTWPAVGPTRRQQQAATGTAPAYERNPKIPLKKGERVAFSNPIYDRGFGGAGIERKVIGINIKQLPGYQYITAFLRKRNMVLKDWDQGLATAADGSSVRIQAELQKAMAAEPAGGGGHMRAQDRLQDFSNRFTSTDRVVLTRNPYDLMTISTGRGPKNCLTIEPVKPGSWSQTLAGSLTQGTLGVYVTKNTDPTLARTGANTMVNPYRAVTGSGDTILSGNYTLYGTAKAVPDGVVQQIAEHIDTSFNANGQAAGHYQVDPDVYAERLTDIRWTP